jgi:hypothetical protein
VQPDAGISFEKYATDPSAKLHVGCDEDVLVKFLYVRTIFPRVRSQAATLLIAPRSFGELRLRGSVGCLCVAAELLARTKKFGEISRS